MSSSCANPVANGSSSYVLSASDPGTCGTARAEFAHHLLGRSLQAADVHQEVIQSLAVQPRSGNCPTSHCRGLARGEAPRAAAAGLGRPPNDVRSSNSPGLVGPHEHALGWANRSRRGRTFPVLRYCGNLLRPTVSGREGWNGAGTDCIPAFCDVDHRSRCAKGVRSSHLVRFVWHIKSRK